MKLLSTLSHIALLLPITIFLEMSLAFCRIPLSKYYSVYDNLLGIKLLLNSVNDYWSVTKTCMFQLTGFIFINISYNFFIKF